MLSTGSGLHGRLLLHGLQIQESRNSRMSSGGYGLVGAMELERLEEEQRWGLTDGGAKMGAGSRRSDGASSRRRSGRAV